LGNSPEKSGDGRNGMRDYCLVWHGHHESILPLEHLWESFADRLDSINIRKAAEETPEKIGVRIKLFRPFVGPLPHLLQAAYEEWVAATLDYRPIKDEWEELVSKRMEIGDTLGVPAKGNIPDKLFTVMLGEFDANSALIHMVEKKLKTFEPRYLAAKTVMIDTLKENVEEIMKLHTTECGCAWSRKCRNIFKYSGVIKGTADDDNDSQNV
jgi:hypothetical protein